MPIRPGRAPNPTPWPRSRERRSAACSRRSAATATPLGSRATTAPFDNIESSFDISGLAIAAGAEKMSREELAGKLVTGILTDIEKPEYTEQYMALAESMRAASATRGVAALPPLPEREPIPAASLLDGETA